VTHRHADHTAGLFGLARRVRILRTWVADQGGEGDPYDSLLEELADAQSVVEVPQPGWTAVVGGFALEVLGPRRRYAGPNDGSIVLGVTAAGRTLLLPGDIEATAQRELGPLLADVMKVPHQGAATSDLEWLAASAPRVAVISVGVNSFGHPAPEVVEALVTAGSMVYRTDRDGTVRLRLDELPGARRGPTDRPAGPARMSVSRPDYRARR
jgi:competence protein ComEC